MDDYDDEHTGQQDGDRDVITQIADRGEVDSDNEDTIFVPNQRTLTRSGRLAGTWKKHFALEDDLREDENSSESDNEENDKSEEDNQSDEIQESDTPDEEELPEPAAPPEPNRSIYSGRTRKPNPKYYF